MLERDNGIIAAKKLAFRATYCCEALLPGRLHAKSAGILPNFSINEDGGVRRSLKQNCISRRLNKIL